MDHLAHFNPEAIATRLPAVRTQLLDELPAVAVGEFDAACRREAVAAGLKAQAAEAFMARLKRQAAEADDSEADDSEADDSEADDSEADDSASSPCFSVRARERLREIKVEEGGSETAIIETAVRRRMNKLLPAD